MDTGTKVYRNYFPIKFGWQADCQYGMAYPVFRKLVYPGDVFKINADLLIRYQPMLTPPMNDCVATVRFGFVPLRLIEEKTELVVTGSKDGKLSSETIPVLDSIFHDLVVTGDNKIVEKHSILDYLYHIPAGLDLSPSGLLAKLDADKASPAAYFYKAYLRFWWDYYRDENLFSYDDFETYWNFRKTRSHFDWPQYVNLKKDRITSSLPWQLKAVAAPTIDINSTGVFTPTGFDINVGNLFKKDISAQNQADLHGNPLSNEAPINVIDGSDANVASMNQKFQDLFSLDVPSEQEINITNLGFNWAQIRELGAQTRIFERLARCGSRYTEYLRANFNVAPSDGTLQRAQYLGGFKTRIVTTEVIQTAEAKSADGSTSYPVGTLRGHGITHGTSTIKPFMAREIGVIIGILDVRPEIIYAQGVDRELTCRSRFDFLNPSFQHLSEQEVRKGEVYFGVDTDADGNLINGQTWGFQPYAQELRTGIKHVCGDMRDSLSYWNQSLIFSSRPQLNQTFMAAQSHRASFNRPFAVSGANSYPMIVDFGGVIQAYRPLIKNGTPGLVDHN